MKFEFVHLQYLPAFFKPAISYPFEVLDWWVEDWFVAWSCGFCSERLTIKLVSSTYALLCLEVGSMLFACSNMILWGTFSVIFSIWVLIVFHMRRAKQPPCPASACYFPGRVQYVERLVPCKVFILCSRLFLLFTNVRQCTLMAPYLLQPRML